MLSKRSIIVLNVVKHSDRGVVIVCYSLEHGREALYFRGGGRARQSFQMIHKLALLDCVVYSGRNGSMPTIKEIVSSHALPELRTNIYKGTMAMFMSELVMRCIREEEPNEKLFALISSSVKLLDAMEEGTANFHLYFIVSLCMALGYAPNSLRVDAGEQFYIPYGRFEKYSSMLPGMWFSPEESNLLEKLLRSRVNEIGEIKCGRDLRLSFAKKMVQYISYHLGAEIEIKSLDVLHEVFG